MEDFDRASVKGVGVKGLVVEGLGFDPFTDSPTVILDHAVGLAPGVFLQSLLLMVNPADLTPSDSVRFLVEHERVSAWWASIQTPAIVSAAGESPLVEDYKFMDRMNESERTIRIAELAREELALALRWSSFVTQERIDQARLLASSLKLTHQALALGEITAAHIRVICDSVERFSSHIELQFAQGAFEECASPATAQRLAAAQAAFDSDCSALQNTVLPFARTHGASRTKTKVGYEIEKIDAEGQARRREAARRIRNVYIKPGDDGISTLIAHLDSLTARAIYRAIEAAAMNSEVPGDCDANAQERRAEALAALVLGIGHAGAPGAEPISVAITLDITIPITACDARTFSSAYPELASGPLGQLVLDPAARIFGRPAFVDEQGHPLDLGRKRYQIGGALRRLIIARDGTCRFPECNRAAHNCQIDHAIAWDDGGASEVSNLGALCVRHHQLKTHGGWDILESKRDGSVTWRSPDGHHYSHLPEPITEPCSRRRPVKKQFPIMPPDPTGDTPKF